MLTTQEVYGLFERNAIALGSCDGVPFYKSVELFGLNAAIYAASNTNRGRWSNIFGIGDFQLRYLTRAGFCQAAAYANVEEISKDALSPSAFDDETTKNQSSLSADEQEALTLFRSMTPDQRTQVLSWMKERHAD